MTRKRVLLVDDSSTALLLQQMILQSRTDFELIIARDGQEAIEKALEVLPDVIVMDVVMPRMSGIEACQQLRLQETTCHIPIIMVTTRGEPENVELGYASGCNDYVTKPVNGAELLWKIDDLIGAEEEALR
jgi:CheY-like chemotaxis protein